MERAVTAHDVRPDEDRDGDQGGVVPVADRCDRIRHERPIFPSWDPTYADAAAHACCFLFIHIELTEENPLDLDLDGLRRVQQESFLGTHAQKSTRDRLRVIESGEEHVGVNDDLQD